MHSHKLLNFDIFIKHFDLFCDCDFFKIDFIIFFIIVIIVWIFCVIWKFVCFDDINIFYFKNIKYYFFKNEIFNHKSIRNFYTLRSMFRHSDVHVEFIRNIVRRQYFWIVIFWKNIILFIVFVRQFFIDI